MRRKARPAVAAKSEREIYEAEYSREREAVEYNEPETREVRSLSYQVRGLSEEDANRFVDQVALDKTQLVRKWGTDGVFAHHR